MTIFVKYATFGFAFALLLSCSFIPKDNRNKSPTPPVVDDGGSSDLDGNDDTDAGSVPSPTPTPNPVGDSVPPEVTTHTPSAGAVNVSVDTDVVVAFNEAMDVESIATAFSLVESTGDVIAGAASLDQKEKVLTFKPNKPLIKDRTYTVTVTTAVKDLAGNGLDEARSWTFSTVGRTWRTSHKLETNDSGYAADSRIVVDAGGSAIAVWNQRVNAVEGIWKNHYTPGSGWGTPELLHSTALGSVYPAIAISDDGDAMVVWISAVGSDKDVFASHYKKGGAWSTPEMIETTVGTADDPSVVAAPDGVFFAAWSDNGTDLRETSGKQQRTSRL